MIEFIQTLAHAYANFLLWAGGGAMLSLTWPMIGAVVFGSVIMAIPIIYIILTGRTGNLMSFLLLPCFFVGLFLACILGITGLQFYQLNFTKCVQFEDKTEFASEPVMILVCQTREHTSEAFGEWKVENLARDPFLSTQIIDLKDFKND